MCADNRNHPPEPHCLAPLCDLIQTGQQDMPEIYLQNNVIFIIFSRFLSRRHDRNGKILPKPSWRKTTTDKKFRINDASD
jgi:hypothetical protein